MEITAGATYYKKLNEQIKELAKNPGEIVVKDVYGHRYIGCGLNKNTKIKIHGTLGNDSGCYMNGAEIEVFGNAQDCVGNTMNEGRIIIHGSCGDITGYAMRGGEIFIKDNGGTRLGLHMKEYMDKKPVIVVGGKTGDFLGEYLAGGRIIILGLDIPEDDYVVGKFCGTGMHGGAIYLRGRVNEALMGKEVSEQELNEDDIKFLETYVQSYCNYFGADKKDIMSKPFKKYYAKNKRPYGKLYTHN